MVDLRDRGAVAGAEVNLLAFNEGRFVVPSPASASIAVQGTAATVRRREAAGAAAIALAAQSAAVRRRQTSGMTTTALAASLAPRRAARATAVANAALTATGSFRRVLRGTGATSVSVSALLTGWYRRRAAAPHPRNMVLQPEPRMFALAAEARDLIVPRAAEPDRLPPARRELP